MFRERRHLKADGTRSCFQTWGDASFTVAVSRLLAIAPAEVFGVIFTRQLFKSLPTELEEAASIDSGGTFRTFRQIILPNACFSAIDLLLVVARVTKLGVERKTGVKHAEVVTGRLVQDERGWLRLAC